MADSSLRKDGEQPRRHVGAPYKRANGEWWANFNEGPTGKKEDCICGACSEKNLTGIRTAILCPACDGTCGCVKVPEPREGREAVAVHLRNRLIELLPIEHVDIERVTLCDELLISQGAQVRCRLPEDHREHDTNNPSGHKFNPKTEKLDEVRARHAAATKGPWRWFGYVRGRGIRYNTRAKKRRLENLHLATTHSGRLFVMTFERSGMRDAQPMFQVYRESRKCGFMEPAGELAECKEYSGELISINNPDAIAIERSWEDIEFLLGEVDRLQAQLSTKEPA